MSQDLLAYARTTVERAARQLPTDDVPAPAGADRPHSGVFVTLRIHGKLRACMGTLDADQLLTDAVRHAAATAALHDPRFAPLTPDELPDLKLELSILTPPVPMRSIDDLELGRHGIIVQSGSRRGLFLPQVATAHHLDKETFLTRCCTEKAHLPPGAWQSPQTQVHLFEADIIEET